MSIGVSTFLSFTLYQSFSKSILERFTTLKLVRMLVLFLITMIVGWILVEVDLVRFFSSFGNTANILQKLLRPNVDIFLPKFGKLMESVFLALLATVFSVPFAFVLSFFSARNLTEETIPLRIIYYFVRTMMTIFRSIEALVWAIICAVWVGIGPFAGMLALWIHSIASLTKLYSEQIENIDHGVIEALKATGARRFHVWIYGVIPQIFSPFLAFTIYRWDINVRMATIVGFVGGGGIGLELIQYQQLMRWREVGMIVVMIAVTVWIMDLISGKLRHYLLQRD
jgi:phosphonate transport system permease protein